MAVVVTLLFFYVPTLATVVQTPETTPNPLAKATMQFGDPSCL